MAMTEAQQAALAEADAKLAAQQTALADVNQRLKPTFGQEVLTSQPARFLTGAGQVIEAGAQMLPRALSAVSSLGGYNPNPISNWLDKEAQNVDQIVANKAQQMEQAKQAVNFQGPDVAGFVGAATNPVQLKLMKHLAPMAKTIPGLMEAGAYTGAVGGALTPVTENTQSFAPQKAIQTGAGAATGTLLGPIGPVLGRGYELAKAMVQPFTEKGRTQILGNLLRTGLRETDVPEITGRLANPTQLVPGSNPTAAEVAQSGWISGLQRSAAAGHPEEYAAREAANIAARKNAVGEIAGDVGKQDLFESSRNLAAKKLYEEAYKQPLNIARNPITGKFLPKAEIEAAQIQMDNLLTKPAIKIAIKEAKDLAANEGINIVNPAGSIQGLDYARKALGKQISLSKDANEKRILMGVMDELDTFLQKQSPKYAEAVGTFAEMSKPLNEMAVGKALADKLTPALGEAGAITKENAAAFADALRRGNATARQATGFPGATLENVFAQNPQHLTTLQNIAADLARKSNAQDLGRGVGSDTFQKLAMANMSNKTGIPVGLIDMPYLGALPRKMYQGATEKMQNQLAQALTDPQETAKLIAMAAPKERSRLMAAALRGVLTPSMLGAVGVPMLNQ